MNTFAPLFQKILDSSIWSEPYHVRILWTAMLALKDSDHVVRYSPYQLHRRANITQKEVMDALKILSSPDTIRSDPQPYQGRRIEKVEDGWLVINGDKYEQEMRDVSRKFYKARKEREYRNKRKGSLLPGESQAVNAARNGASPEEQGEIARRHLPERFQEPSTPYQP